MVVPRSSEQSWRAAFTGSYDDPEIDFLGSFVGPGEWALDVGASLGFYTVPLARFGPVVAAEPVAANRQVIERNLEVNVIRTVQIVPLALGAGRATMTIEVESGGGGSAALRDGVEARHFSGRETETVSVVPLDDLTDFPKGRCAVMKLDVEGFELDVLDGAVSFVAAHRPVIVGEFSKEWMELRGRHSAEVREWARENGYGLLSLRGTRRAWWSDSRVLMPTRYTHGDEVLLVP